MLTIYVSSDGNDEGLGTSESPYATIQAAINAASEEQVILVGEGVYNETLRINKPISLQGISRDSVVINTTHTNGYGLEVEANNVTLSNFTLIGPNQGKNANYGIKATGVEGDEGVDNLSISNITVKNSYKTGLDLHGINSAVIDNVLVQDTIYGVGIAMTDCNDVTLSNITTTNNAWGGMAVFASGQYYPPGGCDNIVLRGNNSFSEDNALYTQVKNGKEVTNLQVANDFTYKATIAETTVYLKSLEGITPISGAVISNLEGTEYYVIEGLRIQDAVTQATTGSKISVLPGTYNENITINKEGIALVGANAGIFATAEGRDTESTIDGSIRITAMGVAVDGFRILNGDVNLSEKAGIYVQADQTTIVNNILVGPNAGDANASWNHSRGIIKAIGKRALNVHSNSFTQWWTGVYLNRGADSNVEGNLFNNNRVGVSADEQTNLYVHKNLIKANDFEGMGAWRADRITITLNEFEDNGMALSYYHDPTKDANYDASINATLNDWRVDDPAEVVNGEVIYEPWLRQIQLDLSHPVTTTSSATNITGTIDAYGIGTPIVKLGDETIEVTENEGLFTFSHSVNLVLGSNNITLEAYVDGEVVEKYTRVSKSVSITRNAPYVPPYIPPYVPPVEKEEVVEEPEVVIPAIPTTNGVKLKVEGTVEEGKTIVSIQKDSLVDVPSGKKIILDASGTDANTDVVVEVSPEAVREIMASRGTMEKPLQVITSHGSIELSSEILNALVKSGQDLKMTTRKTPQVDSIEEGKYLGSESVTISLDGVETGVANITLSLEGVSLIDVNLDRLGVWVNHKDGSNVFYPATVNYEGSGEAESLTITIPKFSTFTIMEYTKTFKDIDGHWAKKDIELALYKQIATGYSKDEFAPNKEITRAEFVSMLVRALELELTDGKTQFTDVDEFAWYASSIKAANEAGIVNGLSATTFAPNGGITREQMAVMIAQAYRVKNGKGLTVGDIAFDDANLISPWAKDSVSGASAAGIIKGVTESIFAPKSNATRAQAVVMIKRLMGW
ncbi:S-layer homology domain-containing protein [Alkaliphilus hydrothermalis]|nr:S-layer homology domain-containing protein [Alkaliphilus hydrothermalis]